jgi:hypothetical protein
MADRVLRASMSRLIPFVKVAIGSFSDYSAYRKETIDEVPPPEGHLCLLCASRVSNIVHMDLLSAVGMHTRGCCAPRSLAVGGFWTALMLPKLDNQHCLHTRTQSLAKIRIDFL